VKKSVAAVLMFLLSAAHVAAREVVLVSHHQRSAAGVLSTLVWQDCGSVGPFTAPCINPANAWVVAKGVVPATATWDWDSATGVLTATGVYQATTYINSNPNGSSVLSDKVSDLRIDTVNRTTGATSYECVEGTFVAGVGSSACGNYRFGDNWIDETSLAYNVGGDPYCVQRTLIGDDSSMGDPRGVNSALPSGSCDSTDGGFLQYNVIQDNVESGGTLVLANTTCLTCANANYMTFQIADEPAAEADATTTGTDTPVTINVLANDHGFADPATVSIVTAPQHGSAIVNGSAGEPSGVTVTYTPSAGFEGLDSFQYQVTDGAATDSATVTISVLPNTRSSAFANDWPMFQGNPAHTGYVAGSLNPSQFALRWQITAANGVALNPVAIGDGRVFATMPTYPNSALYAYDADSGGYLWHVPYNNLYSVNPPAFANGRVYIQTGKSSSEIPPYLRAYDAASGQLAFQSPFGAQWENYAAPTIFEDAVYVNGGVYGGMYAFDAGSGAQHWFRSLAQEDGWTPAVDADHAYAYLNATLSVLDRTSGTIDYTIYGPSGYGQAIPVLGGAQDVIGITNGNLVRFNTASRTIAWQRQRNFAGQPSVANGVIYAIDAGVLTAWDQGQGTLLWSWSAGETLAGAVVVTDSHVLVSGTTRTYAVNIGTRRSCLLYTSGNSCSPAGSSRRAPRASARASR